MKKIIFIVAGMLLMFSPVFSQARDVEENVPVGKLVLKSNQIPPTLESAFQKSFKNETPLEWYSFPYILKKYGWAFKNNLGTTTGSSQPVLYAVEMKTDQGSTIDAVYDENGKLLREKEILKSVELPTPVIKALDNSEYKGCKIVGDKLKITNIKSSMEYYSVAVEKNNKEHRLYFDQNGNRLRNPS